MARLHCPHSRTRLPPPPLLCSFAEVVFMGSRPEHRAGKHAMAPLDPAAKRQWEQDLLAQAQA